MKIALKRVYLPPAQEDGFRILVERLWPRGISKQRAQIRLWLKGVAPSPELRKWYGHDRTKWADFRRRYLAELQQNPEVESLRQAMRGHKAITFVYAASDEEHNSARVLKAFMENYADRGSA